jgi:antitoxin (DNA-binding transcriptional repressor) of toxin-antitoxin stability system
LSARCTATKRNGERCTLPANGPHGLCWAHDPANAEKRRRGASRGGKGKANGDIRDLKRRISEVIDAVLEGSQERGRAAVAIQGFTALRSVLEQERKIKETEDLETRIQALEDLQPAKSKGAHRWR